jgi:hypothetical protein
VAVLVLELDAGGAGDVAGVVEGDLDLVRLPRNFLA